MSTSGFIRRLSDALDGAGVRYMVAGSFASSYHGLPRTTQDLDVVIELDPTSLPRLLQALPDSRYYLSAEAAAEALRLSRQFNVIDFETGWKADSVVKKARPFSEVEFERRVRATILGVPVWVASPEDVIVSKLEWAKLGGGSERQLRDVVGVLDNQSVDSAYIEHWVAALGLGELWAQAQAQARGER